ncbi:unnamed protein product [Pocillopora meandrina]|uniref:HAT C-terminal dimerisation domain-containing protein n=1 Tax=Pocillopora meandrina TaxID=46732 RepID=A0AAU9XUZ3_9CNID|nr:unnamed protein product [Pocillopora meandrina]
MQLLRLMPSTTVACTNVDLVEVSEMYMSDIPSPQTLDIEYDRCTIPVTSADNERSNSTLKLVKGYLRTTMTTERLSSLAFMSIHYEKPFDYDAIVQKFAEQQPRRMLLVDPIFEES